MVELTRREPSDLTKAIAQWIRQNCGEQEAFARKLGMKVGTFRARLSRGYIRADFLLSCARAMGRESIPVEEIFGKADKMK